MATPIDLSELHAALDRLRPQLCHCGLKGECLGCKGIEMVRAQAEAVAAAASQPVLIQVAQETAMKDMSSRFQAMSERLMSDPDIRRSAEQMQERLMADPETPAPPRPGTAAGPLTPAGGPQRPNPRTLDSQPLAGPGRPVDVVPRDVHQVRGRELRPHDRRAGLGCESFRFATDRDGQRHGEVLLGVFAGLRLRDLLPPGLLSVLNLPEWIRCHVLSRAR